jgi:hypothetical protein
MKSRIELQQSITQRQLLPETIRQWFVNPNNEVSTQRRRAILKKPRGLAVLFTTSFWSALLLIATPQFFALEAAAQEKLPPIIIRGTRDPVACIGAACAAVLAELSREFIGRFRQTQEQMPEAFDVDKDKFCKNLASKKPRNCKRTRPAIAGRDGFGGNGCGSSAFSRAAAFATNLAIDGPNSNGVNEPIKGFPFAASCNAHDVCYATQAAPQASCDNGFLTSMQRECGDNADCLGAAARYHAAVASFGEGAYKDSGVALQCYNWHVDMDKAGCGAQKDGITEDEWAAVE